MRGQPSQQQRHVYYFWNTVLLSAMAQLMARTWRCDLTLRIGASSDSCKVCNTFKAILNATLARLEMRGLEYSSFSYDMPEEGLAQISVYMHFNIKFKIRAASVRTWLFDERIRSDGGTRLQPV